MPEIKMKFPSVIAVESLTDLGASNLKNNQELVNKITQEASRGVVAKDGTWAQGIPGWESQKLTEGSYKITHNWGYFNISLGLTLLQSPGSIKLTENHPTYFIVETYLDNKLTDMPFAFTLTKVISP